MNTIVVNAKAIMDAENPLQAVGALFDTQADSLESLRLELQGSDTIRIVEVENWPSPVPGWEAIADMLEGVQQHSSAFFLIWGTRKDEVDTHADTEQVALVDLPGTLPADSSQSISKPAA